MARNKTFNAADDIRFQNTRPDVNAGVTDKKGYSVLNAEDIQPSPFNEGLEMEQLDEYVKSVKESGLIEPIAVYEISPGKYEILSGHQRYEAWCKRLGNKTIKAVVLPYEPDPVKRFKAHTDANTLTRKKDLQFWLSRIKHARKVLADTGFKGTKAEELQKISEMLSGMSKSQLYRYESFEKLIPELQAMESKGYLSANTLYNAVGLDADQQKQVYERVVALQAAKAAKTPDAVDDMEVTREEFIRIVTDVRKGKPSEETPRKRNTFSQRLDKAGTSFLSTLSKSRTKEERLEAIEYIKKLRIQLDEIEKNLS